MGAFAKRHGKRKSDWSGSGITRREALALAALGLIAGAPGAPKAAGAQEQLTWGVQPCRIVCGGGGQPYL